MPNAAGKEKIQASFPPYLLVGIVIRATVGVVADERTNELFIGTFDKTALAVFYVGVISFPWGVYNLFEYMSEYLEEMRDREVLCLGQFNS